VIELSTIARYESAGTAAKMRVRTGTGRQTTAHVARYPRARTTVRLVRLEPPSAVQSSSISDGEALNGGFFTKPEFHPLGELVMGGIAMPARQFMSPWNETRGAIRIEQGQIQIDARDRLHTAAGVDLLQAGPLLVRNGTLVVEADDPEGFSTTCEEFDSDISDGAYPRVALGYSADEVIAVAVDGRAADDDGLTLVELGELMHELGCEAAINLDGGASSSLVTAGERRNTPRSDYEVVLEEGYPTATAFEFCVDA
jgi:hypothetical protein